MSQKIPFSLSRIILLILLVGNGIIFVSSLPVISNPSMAQQIHNDLSPDAGIFIITVKSLLCVIAGIGYLVGAYGLYYNSHLVLAGLAGAAPFFIFYLYEIASWGMTYPGVWIGFLTFGLMSFIICAGCLRFRKV